LGIIFAWQLKKVAMAFEMSKSFDIIEKIINFMNMKTLLMKRVRIMQLQNPD
jgi:hypothetical protein